MDKKRILIVDDEKESSRLLKRNLELSNRYEVQVVNWPEDAVSVARAFRPDLMLLDIIMPRMPGGNVASAFAADPELRDISIVYLTAAVRRHQVAEHEGMICEKPCLAKPASVDEITRCIEDNLPGSGRAWTTSYTLE